MKDDRLTRGVVCNVQCVDEIMIMASKRKRVVCINNDSFKDCLTEYRVYTVLKEDEKYYTIIDDIDAMSDYSKDRFVLLEEYVRNSGKI